MGSPRSTRLTASCLHLAVMRFLRVDPRRRAARAGLILFSYGAFVLPRPWRDRHEETERLAISGQASHRRQEINVVSGDVPVRHIAPSHQRSRPQGCGRTSRGKSHPDLPHSPPELASVHSGTSPDRRHISIGRSRTKVGSPVVDSRRPLSSLLHPTSSRSQGYCATAVDMVSLS